MAFEQYGDMLKTISTEENTRTGHLEHFFSFCLFLSLVYIYILHRNEILRRGVNIHIERIPSRDGSSIRKNLFTYR